MATTSASLQSGKELRDLVALRTTPPLTLASVSFADSGENTLGPALSSGKVVKCYRLVAVFAGTVNARILDGASGTALTGWMSFTAGGSLVLDDAGYQNPWFTSATSKALRMELSAAVQVSGTIGYVQE